MQARFVSDAEHGHEVAVLFLIGVGAVVCGVQCDGLSVGKFSRTPLHSGRIRHGAAGKNIYVGSRVFLHECLSKSRIGAIDGAAERGSHDANVKVFFSPDR